MRSVVARSRGLANKGAVIAVAMALTAACAPGGSSAEGGRPADANEIETDPSSAGELTLTVWDHETQGGSSESLDELNGQFEDRYPNVTIERLSRSLEDLKTTLRLAISSDTAPCVVQANQGYGDMGTFVEADLLVPLDEYAEVYGWKDSFPESILALNSFSPDGKEFATGDLYGVSQRGSMVGLYYSKSRLESFGLEAPSTFEELRGAIATIAERGEQAISFGNAEGYPAIHLLGFVQGGVGDQDYSLDLVFDRGNVTWANEGTLEAAQIIQEWANSESLGKGVNGRSADLALADFQEGKSVFYIGGTWALAELSQAMGSDVGFIVPSGAEGRPVTVGAGGIPFAITANCDNPDVAAAYIEHITNEKAGEVMAEHGVLPVVPPADWQPNPGTVEADVVQAWKTVSADGLVPYYDYATPTFYDTLTSQAQLLLGGKSEPVDFAEALQEDYESFTASR